MAERPINSMSIEISYGDDGQHPRHERLEWITEVHPVAVPYTLTEDDIQACRRILRRMMADDEITGGYAIGNVQAYPSKAQVMIEFANKCGGHAVPQGHRPL